MFIAKTKKNLTIWLFSVIVKKNLALFCYFWGGANRLAIIKFGWAATDHTIRDLFMYASQT